MDKSLVVSNEKFTPWKVWYLNKIIIVNWCHIITNSEISRRSAYPNIFNASRKLIVPVRLSPAPITFNGAMIVKYFVRRKVIDPVFIYTVIAAAAELYSWTASQIRKSRVYQRIAKVLFTYLRVYSSLNVDSLVNVLEMTVHSPEVQSWQHFDLFPYSFEM